MKAPFNFVPVSEKVYFPKWASQISQDIPFSDGLDGKIELEITAETPIFIRNGHAKEEEKSEEGFSHIDTRLGPRYFIPATSVKGEVRTILDIMSYGRLNVDKNAMFARRDLTPNADYPLKTDMSSVRCGYLRRSSNGEDEDSYEIVDCGKPMRISHKEIDNYIGDEVMRSNFSKESKLDLRKEVNGYDPKSAAYKYHLLKGYQLENLQFTEIGTNAVGQKLLTVDQNGNIEGSIVLTGQPDKWDSRDDRDNHSKPRGKYYEFVFISSSDKKVIPIKKEQFNHFKFIYSDSPEYNRIRQNLNSNCGQPVFFRPTGDGKAVKDFGLSYLYKLPYEHSVYESLPEEHKKSELTLSECIFGRVGERGDALKGRVQFGNAFAEGSPKELPPVKLILSSPKASYYPEYIAQSGKSGRVMGNYQTYDNGIPSGWKKYYLRGDVWQGSASVNGDGVDTQNTTIYPLPVGTRFTGEITFHNLRPVELGALLSALCFNGSEGNRHQLGMAKPYGYGKCRYTTKLNILRGKAMEQEYYIAFFDAEMDEFLGKPWKESQQIKELLAISSKSVPNDERSKYMHLDTNGHNEFKDAKTGKEYLQRASELYGFGDTGDNDKVKGYSEQIIKDREKAKQERERLEKEATRQKLVERINALNSLDIAAYDKLIADIIKSGDEQLFTELEQKWKELRRSASQWTATKINAATFEAFCPRITSAGQLIDRLEKYLKENHCITDNDIAWARSGLKKIKDKIKDKDIKSCERVLGSELTNKLFNDL